ncbi:hypothetical protein OH77DRAFT_1430904 [Trametes cingulata]|nr:hypothetical protein OH77DRAFT_1430904 [Trametes cingulata]
MGEAALVFVDAVRRAHGGEGSQPSTKQHRDAKYAALLIRRNEVLCSKELRHRELRQLNESLNSFSPVNTLPLETLTEILRIVQAAIFTSSDQGSVARRWLAITSVCRHWREVIVGNPAFWRSIAVERAPELLTTFLCRVSGPVPISIHFYNPHFPWKEVATLLEHWTPTVRLLRFEQLDRDSSMRHIRKLFKAPMPALEELYLAAPGDEMNVFRASREKLSSLASLALTGLSLHVDIPLFSHLRHLKLRNCDWNLDFVQFLELLDTCSQLEELDLDLSLPDLDEDPDTGPLLAADGSRRAPVTVGQLHTLRLVHHENRHTANALSYLHFPKARCIEIVADLGDEEEETFLDEAIVSILPKDPLSVFPVLATVTSVDPVDLTAMNEKYEQRMRNRAGASVNFTIYYGGSQEETSWGDHEAAGLVAIDELPDICPGAPVTSLHTTARFNVDGYDQWPVEAWKDVFERFSALEQLSVAGSGLCRPMWEALNEGPDTWELGESPSLWWEGRISPSLRCISIDVAASYVDEQDFALMIEAIETCVACGLFLELLVLDFQTLPKERYKAYKRNYLGSLRAFVPVVIFRGVDGHAARDLGRLLRGEWGGDTEDSTDESNDSDEDARGMWDVGDEEDEEYEEDEEDEEDEEEDEDEEDEEEEDGEDGVAESEGDEQL